MNFHEINVSDVFAGDVLLCFSKMTAQEPQAGETGYSHVAIALESQKVLEAAPAGVRMNTVNGLLGEYDHVAVMRSAELWDTERLADLEKFANHTVGTRFNNAGMVRFSERKEKNETTLMERVEQFFAGTGQEVLSKRGVYFCSELVTAAFIDVGIIDKSAAVLFTPESFSPSDVGKDKLFGFFCGYIKSYPEYKLPDDDFFANNP